MSKKHCKVSCDSDIGRTAEYQKNQVCACCSIPHSFKNELKFGDVHMHFTVRILSLPVVGDLFFFKLIVLNIGNMIIFSK